MLLANLEPEVLGQDPWMAFIHLLQRREPLLVVEVAEELVRAGHAVPDDRWLSAAAEQSNHWHQYCVLFLSLRQDSGPVDRWSSVPRRAEKRSSEFASGCLNRRVEGAGPSSQTMVERLLPAEDPVLENVLKWTVERDARRASLA